ncbi:hypothetical protein EIN_054600 [Entamoeba invadens IP1]|uniref:hypothetical protein n=1 Tax=Entamoeba invadens IP1 TaxID=370355 RepID=UPI0002C3D778|nr:hypothetical protein EIN_054600 [Entamoeba invadens IP1]ELP93175.1 hypothetical protein EIN_054600 [Entamoeba invadens IP1]|eukprot:XP_004259946.1 hypothetical protein EIN_054600 [Entamoeba invadens IP1]
MNDKGGSTFDLSLLQTVAYVIYSVLSPIGGKIGDKFNPYIVVRISFVFFIIGVAVILIFPSSIPALYVSVCIWPFCTAVFWPVATGTIGLESPLGYENRNTSLFQVSWSFGKCFGFLFGGMLKTALGMNSLYVCIVLVALLFVVYPFTHPKRIREKMAKNKKPKKDLDKEKVSIDLSQKNSTKEEKEPGDIAVEMEHMETKKNGDIADIDIALDRKDIPEGLIQNPTASSITPPSGDIKEVQIPVEVTSDTAEMHKMKFKWGDAELKNKTYIYLGYILQCGVYGTSAIVTSSYVKLAQDLEVVSPTKTIDMYVGVEFFFFYLAQTVSMAAMSITLAWTYKRSLFLIFQTGYILFLLVIGVSRNAYLNWFMAFVGGLAAGFSYQTSTYYSMCASENSKSMFMGISECISGFGNCILPLTSGLLCTYLYNDYIMIYVSAATVLVCIILQEIVYHVAFPINKMRQSKRANPTDVKISLDTVAVEQQTNREKSDEIKIVQHTSSSNEEIKQTPISVDSKDIVPQN